jgi:hypothetical protein
MYKGNLLPFADGDRVSVVPALRQDWERKFATVTSIHPDETISVCSCFLEDGSSQCMVTIDTNDKSLTSVPAFFFQRVDVPLIDVREGATGKLVAQFDSHLDAVNAVRAMHPRDAESVRIWNHRPGVDELFYI